jgi:hypothetical protein
LGPPPRVSSTTTWASPTGSTGSSIRRENYTNALKLNPRDPDAAFNRDLALRALKEPGKKIEGRPRPKKEIARTDLPDDIRKSTSRKKAARTKQVRKTQKKRAIKK